MFLYAMVWFSIRIQERYMGGSKDVIIGMEGDNENNVIKLKFKRLQPAVQLPVGSICLRREAACRRRT